MGSLLDQKEPINTENEVEKTTNKSTKSFNSYTDEANSSLSWGNGKLLSTVNKVYSGEKEGVRSPLLEGKNVEISTYSYKSKTIIHKNINIDDFTSLSIWQYGNFNRDEKIQDFSIFRGYENYNNWAIPVQIIVDGWSDLYKTKNNIDMYYEYFFTPKSIGYIGLSSYWTYLPYVDGSKPSLITIYYSKIDGFAQDSDDPILSEAKIKLNQVADTILIVDSD